MTWNLEWAAPASQRGRELLRRLDQHAPEVVCLTETHADFMAHRGHTICAQQDYGYGAKGSRRKVLLWSREPWTNVDCLGIASLPPGRFVAGVTRTSLGDITVAGVGIPWFGSRTEAYRGLDRRRRWQDHEEYLAGLTEVLARMTTTRLIVIGDFNQVIGVKGRAPAELRQALRAAFPPPVSIATADIAFGGRSSIDHIALSSDLVVESLCVLSNVQTGRALSDHFGIVADVSARPSSMSHTHKEERP